VLVLVLVLGLGLVALMALDHSDRADSADAVETHCHAPPATLACLALMPPRQTSFPQLSLRLARPPPPTPPPPLLALALSGFLSRQVTMLQTALSDERVKAANKAKCVAAEKDAEWGVKLQEANDAAQRQQAAAEQREAERARTIAALQVRVCYCVCGGWGGA
jgi:hypothetical protein